jgi:L-alanine-DL-glutamate epimerase-like enolase superfamily enzyme
MIKEIFIEKRTLHFLKPFKIAYENLNSAKVIIIKIVDENNFYGLGSAAPDQLVTGETPEKIFKILRKKVNKNFFEYSIDEIYKYHEKIQKEFSGFPSAQSAIEEAILNLFCQTKNLSLKNLFGDYRKECDVNVSIGIQEKKDVIEEVQKRINEGFKIIKVKCGLNLKEDIEKIKALIKILPSDVKLGLDANQGYSFLEAKKLLEEIKDIRIAFLEQPISAKDVIGLKKLHLSTKIPIIADESIVGVEDAISLLLNDCVDGVNIKLMKCGGPINFLKIFQLAKSLNKITMIGCMYESNISITTGAHLALALPIEFVELDSGHFDFCDDSVEGGAEIKNGQIEIVKNLKLA